MNTQNVPDFMSNPNKFLGGQEVGVSFPTRGEYKGKNFRAEIVLKDEDIIYQLFDFRVKDMRNLMAEVIESHFGSTESFRAAEIPELDSLGIIAKKVRSYPLFNFKHYTEDFLSLTDKVLGEL